MKISIIGAGIAGLSTAIALRRWPRPRTGNLRGKSCGPKAAGAGLALGANAVMAFDQIGVKNQVLAVSNVLEHFEILDATGRVITMSDNLAINRNLQTVSNFAVHRADLQRVLLAEYLACPCA